MTAVVVTDLLVFPLHLYQLSLHLGLFLLHLDQLLIFSLHFLLLPGNLQQRLHLQVQMNREASEDDTHSGCPGG